MNPEVELADAILDAAPPQRRDRWATVIDDTPFTIDIEASGIPVVGAAILGGYAPAVGDLVLVSIVDGEPLVRGKV